MLTASFSEARQNLTEIADRVANEGVEYTVFKHSKPLFKIVPVAQNGNATAAGKVVDIPRTRQETMEYYADRRAPVKPELLHPEIPSGGEELLEYAMALRERCKKVTPLTAMTVEEMKRELRERHA